MKESAKYLGTICAFMAVSFVLSWCAVYSFWWAARLFHSVQAVRICDALGSVVLVPVRVLFWLASDFVDQSMPLTDPLQYAIINAVLTGILAYGCCRHRIFGPAAGG